MLVDRHGERVLDRIVAEAHRDVRFRYALSCVWAWESPVRPEIDFLLAKLEEPLR